MTDTDKRAFADSMTALGMVFGVPVEKALLAAYWQFLRDLELPAFTAAVATAGRTLKWFPKPAELLDLAGAGATARKLEAAESWEMVRLAMDQFDYTTSVDFGPLVNAVIRNLGGWEALCDRSLRELVFERKRFEETFVLFASCSAGLRGDPLPGHFGGEPVRIGLAGRTAPRQLGAGAPVNSMVRQLAENKAIR